MLEYQIGQIVYSKSGHDKGEAMLILSVEGRYLYLVNGKTRRLEKPKCKKMIHVQPTHYVDTAIAEKLRRNEAIQDAEIRKAIKMFQVKAVDC